VGMIVTTLVTLTLLPALLAGFDRQRSRRSDPRMVAPKDTGSGDGEPHRAGSGRGIPSLRVKPLLNFTRRRSMAFLVVGGAGLVFSLWGTKSLRFDLNMLHLQAQAAESVFWEKQLLQDTKRSSMYGVVLARSLDEVRSKSEALKRLPSVLEVQNLDMFLPEGQKEKIEILHQLKPLLTRIGSLPASGESFNLSQFDEVLGRIRFKMFTPPDETWGADEETKRKMQEAGKLVDSLRRRIRGGRGPELVGALHEFEMAFLGDLAEKVDLLRMNANGRPMEVSDLPGPLVSRLTAPGGLYLIKVYSSQNVWDPEILGGFVHDLQSVDPDAIGDPITLYVFMQDFRNACIQASLYAGVFILLLLLFTFRNFLSAMLAMVPLLVGTAWTMGMMDLFGIDLNLANSLFLPLVVGAGVEYGIIVVQRWRQKGEQGEPLLPFSTGKGVILAGLTTTVGFGSLSISGHHGIYTLGLLSTIGSLCVLAAAVLFLPALLRFLSLPTKNRNGF